MNGKLFYNLDWDEDKILQLRSISYPTALPTKVCKIGNVMKNLIMGRCSQRPKVVYIHNYCVGGKENNFCLQVLYLVSRRKRPFIAT